MAWRYLMVVSTLLLMITFCYICFEMARRRNFDVPWMKACCGCLVAGSYILTQNVISIMKCYLDNET